MKDFIQKQFEQNGLYSNNIEQNVNYLKLKSGLNRSSNSYKNKITQR